MTPACCRQLQHDACCYLSTSTVGQHILPSTLPNIAGHVADADAWPHVARTQLTFGMPIPIQHDTAPAGPPPATSCTSLQHHTLASSPAPAPPACSHYKLVAWVPQDCRRLLTPTLTGSSSACWPPACRWQPAHQTQQHLPWYLGLQHTALNCC